MGWEQQINVRNGGRITKIFGLGVNFVEMPLTEIAALGI